MSDKKNQKGGHRSSPRPKRDKPDKENVAFRAREEAQHDIEQDPEISSHSPNDDLDEGETARLGDEKTGLI